MKNQTEEKPRVLLTVTGRNKAIAEILSFAVCFNDCNGQSRMEIADSKLAAYDNEGSGEYFAAVCLNLNEAESCDSEIYEIQTCW